MADRTELFKTLLECNQDLSSFLPYAFEGATEGMISSKIRALADKLLVAVGDKK